MLDVSQQYLIFLGEEQAIIACGNRGDTFSFTIFE